MYQNKFIIGPAQLNFEPDVALLVLRLDDPENAIEQAIAMQYAELMRNSDPKLNIELVSYLAKFSMVPNQLSIPFQGENATAEEKRSDNPFGIAPVPEIEKTVAGILPTWEIYLEGTPGAITTAKGVGFLEACLTALVDNQALPLDMDAYGRTSLKDGVPMIRGVKLTYTPQ